MDANPENPEPEQPARAGGRERWAGTVMILISTVCYGISNTTIRLLTEYDIDKDWILFFKEGTGLCVIFPWLVFRFFQGRHRLISKRQILYVAIAAVFCELIGARLHVLGFAVLGLVVAVPLVQSSTLLGTAFLGRYCLGDPISRRRRWAIVILILSVVLLSVGKELTVGPIVEPVPSSAQPAPPETPPKETGVLLSVALGTILAGAAYSIYIITLRFVLLKFWHDTNSVWLSFQFTQWAGYDYPNRDTASHEKVYSPFPVTLIMNIVLGVGVLVFGSFLFAREGIAGFYEVPPIAWTLVSVSGICNVTGFFFQVQGLRVTTAVQASLIAVSQMLVLSLIGIRFFGEPVNSPVFLGLTLTVVGVFLSAKPER